MPLNPLYVPIDPHEQEDIASSIPVLRTSDNTIFLASKIPGVYTKDSPLDPRDIGVPSESDSENIQKQKSNQSSYNTKLASVILPHASLPLSRILNHPNIISLVDIIHNPSLPGRNSATGPYGDLTIWEDMNAGSLAYLMRSVNSLPHITDKAAWERLAAPNPSRPSLPEGLCWHVLRSISRALLWLHHGIKETGGTPDQWVKHDDDWHAILIMDVSPSQIWFKKPGGRKGESYGECKLGGFQWAKVCGSVGARVVSASRIEDAPEYKRWYWAPEVYNNTASWNRASELWSLGAVIYTMMTDMPPPRICSYDWQISRMNDKGYTQDLRHIVADMLKPIAEERPRILELIGRIDEKWRWWRANTREGQEYVDVGDEALAKRLSLYDS